MSQAPGPLYANRVRVYPMAVHGIMRRIKWGVLSLCLGIYYLLPWLRWDRGDGVPDQALLLDLYHRRFYIFWLELWPQEIIFLAGMLILAAVSLFLVTSLAGRIWCGYTCPQTVWTDLFMWVERQIEGDRNERMRRDAKPMSFDSVWRKTTKHIAWLAIAFWTGGAWIMYFVDAPTVVRQFWSGSASTPVYGFIFIFTASTYTLAGWAREQVCTYMCPWPRFQSSMMDEHSFTTTYQAWRGEPRTRGKAETAISERTGGDCIDCGACVSACPTGIDIRDGIQLECIDCGLCMDACNHVMEKLDRPKWLITWDNLARQAQRAQGQTPTIRLLRPRTLIYVAALSAAIMTMGVALATRATLSVSVQRDRAPLFVLLPSGALRNGYTLHVLNKTAQASVYELTIEGLPGAKLAVAEAGLAAMAAVRLPVGQDQLGNFRILVTASPQALDHGAQHVTFVLRDNSTGITAHYDAVFMGPADFQGDGHPAEESH